MKVFIATSGSYSDYDVDAVFSTRALADAYNKKRHSEYGDVLEMEVDAEISAVKYQEYAVSIRLDTGALYSNTESTSFGVPRASHRISTDLAIGSSPKSKDHAMKLAVEARQHWLREKGQKDAAKP